VHRTHPGYGTRTFYVNTTGRNDIVLCKIARDAKSLYFYAETAESITPATGRHWMMLLIDTDRDGSTGWEGYEFAVNRIPPQGNAFLEWNGGDWKWQAVGRVKLSVRANAIELAVPREYVGLKGTHLALEFKWIDNLQHAGDIMDCYQYGDAAPGGRFNYVFSDSTR
jgi:hypothetical protein